MTNHPNRSKSSQITKRLEELAKSPVPLLDREFYWVWASGIDPENPLKLGQYEDDGWWFEENGYNIGPGITALAHIPKPDII